MCNVLAPTLGARISRTCCSLGRRTGKTTAAMALTKDIFGEDYRQNLLEMNASDERKLESIRTKVKQFARTQPYGGAAFKIIFLDEADALTNDAQGALRRIMEQYAETCRFILSCNYSSKIIEPIQSRCAVFRFRPLSDADVSSQVVHVAGLENLTLGDGAVEALTRISQGDLRKALTALQVAAALNNTVSRELVYETSATAPQRPCTSTSWPAETTDSTLPAAGSENCLTSLALPGRIL